MDLLLDENRYHPADTVEGGGVNTERGALGRVAAVGSLVRW